MVTTRHIPRRISAALIACATLVVSTAGPAYADLGNCVKPPDHHPHQGAFESDVPSTTKGIVARVMVRSPDLCDTPDVYDSGSAVYIMLTNYAFINQTGTQVLWQIGYRKNGPSCTRWFMQYLGAQGQVVDKPSPSCAANGVWHTLVMRRSPYQGGYAWQSYVLDSTNSYYVWSAPNDPTNLSFPPEDGEFMSEVANPTDQSGGSNNYPAYLDNAYWWDSGYSIHYTNFQASEKRCDRCGTPWPAPNGPYNTSYPDNSTIRIWTDGF